MLEPAADVYEVHFYYDKTATFFARLLYFFEGNATACISTSAEGLSDVPEVTPYGNGKVNTGTQGLHSAV